MKKMLLSLLFVSHISHAQYSVFPITSKNEIVNENVFGSTVEISKDTFLTNCHSLKGTQKVTIYGNSRYIFSQAWMLSSHDICILGSSIPIDIKTRDAVVGESIQVIGYINGSEKFQQVGVVEEINGKFLKVSSSWPEGVSGGAILGMDGMLLAIPTFATVKENKYYGIILKNENLQEFKKLSISSVTRSALYENRVILNESASKK